MYDNLDITQAEIQQEWIINRLTEIKKADNISQE